MLRCFLVKIAGTAVSASFISFFVGRDLLADLVRGRNPAKRYADYRKENRGMSVVHDWSDWLGGYPFEVAKPGEVLELAERFPARHRDRIGGHFP